jgi:hypothetical protein
MYDNKRCFISSFRNCFIDTFNPVEFMFSGGLDQAGSDAGHIWIDERIERVPPYKRYTVVIYGYDMSNNQIAYFNPITGFCGWVNYSSFLTNYSENGSPSSFSNDMVAVFPRID